MLRKLALAGAMLLALVAAPSVAFAACADTGNTANGLTSTAQLEILRDLCNGTDASAGIAVTITRTADTNAYTANDVIGAATGSTAAITFTGLAPNGAGEWLISRIQLEIDATAIISGETGYSLYLYNVTPPSALGDNAAFDIPSGDRASFIGKVDLGSPVDEGSTLYIERDLAKQIKTASANVFGYLVTQGAYTPTSARVYVVTLHTVRAQ